MSKKSGKNYVNSSNLEINKDKSLQILKLALEELKEKYNVGSQDILRLIDKPISKEILIPVSIFEFSDLSALETICKYLKEELDFTYSKIASLLNRDSRTIWTTYHTASKKRKEKLLVSGTRFSVPASALHNRKFSVLEAIVGYLKDNYNLRYSQIALLLNRNERNIWATYNHYKKKK